MLALGIGFVMGLAIAALMEGLGIARERGAWAVLIAAIAAFWVLFATMTGDVEPILFHAGVACGFLLLAALGVRGSGWWLVGALALHSLFDAFSGEHAPDAAPSWWAAFCLGVDATLAAWLAVML